MVIVDSTFDTNSAEEYAGGIYALVGPTLSCCVHLMDSSLCDSEVLWYSRAALS